MSSGRAMDLSRRITEAWKAAMEQGQDSVVLLCDFRVRPHLSAMLSRPLPQLPVLAYDEIAVGTRIQAIGTVSLPSQQGELVGEVKPS
jgi:flagellar biosynthesis component FlhA